MKNLGLKVIFCLTVICAVLLAFPGVALAQSPDQDGQLVLGGSFLLENGQRLDGDLAVFGGTATLEENSKVDGNVFIAGGSLFVDGEIDGDVVAFGGSITLDDDAVVRGNINTVGASLSRADNAVVEGDIKSGQPEDYNLDIKPPIIMPFSGFNDTQSDGLSRISNFLKPVGRVLWVFMQAFAAAALAALLALLLLENTERVAGAIIREPIVAGGLGLLTIIVAPMLLIILLITICLAPVGIVGFLLLGLAILYGWIALGLEIGRRMENSLKQHWAPPVSAGIGTFILSLVSSLVGIIPCVGWVLPFLVSMVGLGGVLISRFGTQGSYPSSFHIPAAPAMPTPVEPPQGPEQTN
jgi:cytoskeletal protein CcmA (bactofilin family)